MHESQVFSPYGFSRRSGDGLTVEWHQPRRFQTRCGECDMWYHYTRTRSFVRRICLFKKDCLDIQIFKTFGNRGKQAFPRRCTGTFHDAKTSRFSIGVLITQARVLLLVPSFGGCRNWQVGTDSNSGLEEGKTRNVHMIDSEYRCFRKLTYHSRAKIARHKPTPERLSALCNVSRSLPFFLEQRIQRLFARYISCGLFISSSAATIRLATDIADTGPHRIVFWASRTF